MKIQYRLMVALAIVTGIVPTAQAAGQLQGRLNVKITIGAGCTVVNGTNNGSVNNFGDLDFGTHYDLNNVINGQSTGAAGGPMAVQCTTGTPYTVALDGGQNANGSTRRMLGGSTEYVSYALFQDTARSLPWGNNDAFGTRVSATGNGNTQAITVFGRVPSQTTPSASAYNDIVLVTVAW